MNRIWHWMARMMVCILQRDHKRGNASSETRRSALFEIGYDQGEAVQALLAANGYTEIAVVKDYAGLDRVVYGTFLGGSSNV